MDQPHPNAKKTGLLVSVRNVNEAVIAHSTGCLSIIDLKEPDNGSLGCVSAETAEAICDALPIQATKSIALGEVSDCPLWPECDPQRRRDLLSRFRYAKIGLAGLAEVPDWIDKWRQAFDRVPASVQRVAVAYADSERAKSPTVISVIESARLVEATVLLLDTFQKDRGGLSDIIPPPDLLKITKQASQAGLTVVLAGSLSARDLPMIDSLAADIVAVRGAVCRSNRSSLIDSAKIRSFAQLLATKHSQSHRTTPADSNR